MNKKASGFYADSLEMLLDTMCNVLGMVIFITLTLAQLVRHSTAATAVPPASTLTNELASVTGTNALVEAQLQELALKLQEQHQSQTNLMSLPSVNKADRTPWTVIVHDGRLYPLNVLAPGSRSGTARNLRTLTWQGRSVGPRLGQGDDPINGVEEMIEAFRANSKTNFYFAFEVYEDSFEAFNLAKETVVKLGFQYGWEPLPADRQLAVGGHEAIPIQN